MPEKISCSVQVLTLNSAKTLEKCLESVKEFAEIIILDGNSTDNTIEIAKRYTDKIYPQADTNEKNIRITDFGAVRNRGLRFARHDWFLFIDSDECLSTEAAEEIREIICRGKENEYFVYNVPRMYVLDGVVLEHMRPAYQARFFYLPAVEGFIKKVHERVRPKNGCEIGALKHPEYVPLEDIAVLKKKWSRYIDLQLQDMQVTPKVLFLKTKANLRKFLAYCAKYAISAAQGRGAPFRYEYYNALYHLKIIWRVWKLFITQKL